MQHGDSSGTLPASHRTCPFNATLDGQRTPAYTDLDNGTRWLQYDALLRPCQTVGTSITPSLGQVRVVEIVGTRRACIRWYCPS